MWLLSLILSSCHFHLPNKQSVALVVNTSGTRWHFHKNTRCQDAALAFVHLCADFAGSKPYKTNKERIAIYVMSRTKQRELSLTNIQDLIQTDGENCSSGHLEKRWMVSFGEIIVNTENLFSQNCKKFSNARVEIASLSTDNNLWLEDNSSSLSTLWSSPCHPLVSTTGYFCLLG